MFRRGIILIALSLASCKLPFQGNLDEKFGDQHFKSAVAMIELHNTRNGRYPESLDDLEYLGDWDAIWIAAVMYEKTDGGYDLFVERGWAGEPELTFPQSFRDGLGLRETNVQWTE